MNDQIFYVGQKAFIEKDGKVLILFLPNGKLDFPGGKIQEGETDLLKAFKREVTEETGLEIEILNPFYTWYFEFSNDHPKSGKKVFLVGYKCKYLSGNIKLSEEHSNFKWIDKSNYKEYTDERGHFKALKKYFQILVT